MGLVSVLNKARWTVSESRSYREKIFAKLRNLRKQIADVALTKMSRRIFILIDAKVSQASHPSQICRRITRVKLLDPLLHAHSLSNHG